MAYKKFLGLAKLRVLPLKQDGRFILKANHFFYVTGC